jgi:hypothetical protein
MHGHGRARIARDRAAGLKVYDDRVIRQSLSESRTFEPGLLRVGRISGTPIVRYFSITRLTAVPFFPQPFSVSFFNNRRNDQFDGGLR